MYNSQNIHNNTTMGLSTNSNAGMFQNGNNMMSTHSNHGNNRSSTYELMTSYPGGDYNVVNATGPGQCENLCLNDNNCRAWTYVTNINHCKLKNEIRQPISDMNSISGRIFTNISPPPPVAPSMPVPAPVAPSMPCPPVPPHITTQSVRLQNVDCPGSNMSTFLSPNSTECNEACLHNNNCRQWTFTPGRNTCQLKNNYQTCIGTNNRISGIIIRDNSQLHANNQHNSQNNRQNVGQLQSMSGDMFSQNGLTDMSVSYWNGLEISENNTGLWNTSNGFWMPNQNNWM